MRIRLNGAIVALGLGVVTLAAAGGAAVGLARPQLDVADGLGIAEVHEARATAALAASAPDAAAIRLAAAETRRSLALAPANPRPWLRLAYIETLRSGALTAPALEHLERSYVLAPYGPDDTPWRLSFMFQHWDRLTPSLRRLALRELAVDRRGRRALGRQLMGEVSNPSGRVALALMLAEPTH